LIQTRRIPVVVQEVNITSCEIWLQRLIGSDSLEQRYGGYRGDQPTRIMLGCSMVLGHESDVLFVLFGREMKD